MSERRAPLREVWRDRITIEDYERHMAAVGQAQANASLLEDLFLQFAPRLGARILFAGAGTGQCFDYLPANLLGRYHATFADINPGYLARLAERLAGTDIATVVDDIEATRLAGPFDLAIAVLVLEHVDWRRAVASLVRQAARVFVVIQQNPATPPPSRLEGTMTMLYESTPTLPDPATLVAAFEAHGFAATRTSLREVPDEKRLLAFDFCRGTAADRIRQG